MTSLDSVTEVVRSLRNEPFHEPVADTHEERIAIMADRWANKRDIWTGRPLTIAEQVNMAIEEEEE